MARDNKQKPCRKQPYEKPTREPEEQDEQGGAPSRSNNHAYLSQLYQSPSNLPRSKSGRVKWDQHEFACVECQAAKQRCIKGPVGCERCLKRGIVCIPGMGKKPGPKPCKQLPNNPSSLQAAHAGNDVSMDAAHNQLPVASASFYSVLLVGQGQRSRFMDCAAHNSSRMGQTPSHVRPHHSPLPYPVQRSAAPAPTLTQEAFPVQSARDQHVRMLGQPTSYMDVPQVLMSPTPGYCKLNSSTSLPISRNYGAPLVPFETGPNLREEHSMNTQFTPWNHGSPASAFEVHRNIAPIHYEDIGAPMDQYNAPITLSTPPPMPGYPESNDASCSLMLEGGMSNMFASTVDYPSSGLRLDTSFSYHNTGLAGPGFATGGGAALPQLAGFGSMGTMGQIMPNVSPSTPGMTVTSTSSNGYHASAFDLPAPSTQHQTMPDLTADDHVMNFGPQIAAPAGPYPQHDQVFSGARFSMPMNLEYSGETLDDHVREFKGQYGQRGY